MPPRSGLIDLGPDSGPRAVAVDTRSNRIYVGNGSSQSLSIIDGVTNTLVGEVALDQAPIGIVADARSGRIYVANYEGTVSIVDGASLAVIRELHVGGTPTGITIDSKLGRVYVANTRSRNVAVIETAESGSPTFLAVRSLGIAADSRSGSVYVSDGRQLTVVDGRSAQPSSAIEGAGPVIGLHPEEGVVYAGSTDRKSLSVIDTGRGEITARLRVGFGPIAILANLETQEGVVVSAGARNVESTDPDSGIVTLIRDRSVVDTFALALAPSAAALNWETKTLYVTDALAGTVSVVPLRNLR